MKNTLNILRVLKHDFFTQEMSLKSPEGYISSLCKGREYEVIIRYFRIVFSSLILTTLAIGLGVAYFTISPEPNPLMVKSCAISIGFLSLVIIFFFLRLRRWNKEIRDAVSDIGREWRALNRLITEDKIYLHGFTTEKTLYHYGKKAWNAQIEGKMITSKRFLVILHLFRTKTMFHTSVQEEMDYFGGEKISDEVSRDYAKRKTVKLYGPHGSHNKRIEGIK